jgi:hypothetical protein
MASMMDLMFPAAPAADASADRSHYGGALESSACYEADADNMRAATEHGQGHVGRTLRACNRDRSVKLPSKFFITIQTRLMGQRVADQDESRNRFGQGERDEKHAVVSETTHSIEITDPECTIYSVKLAVMELSQLVGALVVMKWQAVLRVDGQIVSDICSLADYGNHVLDGTWDCVLQEKHELLVLDNGCT